MARIIQTFTSTQNWTVPPNCYILEVFMVGGGGGGGTGGSSLGGGGGAGGQVVLVKNVQVTPGQSISVAIGQGGNPGSAGGTTSFGSLSALGGSAGGASGGSTSRVILGTTTNFTGSPNGGGGAGADASATSKTGANGYIFGNVRYAAGGGGGIDTFTNLTPRPILPFLGGVDGGGKGATEDSPNTPEIDHPAGPGQANTGSGGGGGAASGESQSPVWVNDPSARPNNKFVYLTSPATPGAVGGSGIVIVTFDEATFQLTTSQPGVQEGGSIVLNLSTRNVWNGASVGYTISGTNITAGDFNPPSLTGSLTVASSDQGISGVGTSIITTSADALKETDIETATVSLNNGFAVTSFLIGDSSQSELENIESKTIATSDYNVVQGKIALVLGNSQSTAASYGWGQIVQSSQVNLSTKVGATEWNTLRNDIINSWVHLYNATPPLSSAIENSVVRGNILNAPYAQYDSYANAILANRFGVHPSQSVVSNRASAETAWPGTFGLTWNGRIFSVVLATWPSSQAARQFFNSGGEIRISSNRIGGASTNQNAAWTSLLSTSGARAFGADKPGKGLSPINGQNFYRLRSSFDVWYETSSSNPYSLNTYKISARSPGVADNSNGSALSVEFLIEWIDNYTAGGGALDQVDGTISLNVATLDPIGSLVPSGTGNFSVVAPTINVTTTPRP